MDFVVTTSHPDILLYVDSLQKKNAEALSFYPKSVFEREIEKGRVFLGLLNGTPCGYLYAGAQNRDVKLHQVCIEYDARRRQYGESIVKVMEDYANQGKAYSITLRCGFDLEANDFWQALGYQCVGHQQGGVRRMRTINIWRKQLQAELFDNPILQPAEGKTDASIWRKNKTTGIVTQFARGKKMEQYREMINAENKSTKL